MSVTTVSFHESTLPSETYIASLGENESGAPYSVHGVALGPGDVTKGASGIKKLWPAEELQKAADTLEETNLVVDHENNADGVVGRVVKAGYKEGTGVIYEAELYEEDLADKIENGLLEVSIRGYHADVESLEEDDETGALVVEDITFDNLSIVPKGASPSNTLKMGEHEELSAAELQAAIGEMEAELLDEAEPGMWVEGDDVKGITVGQPAGDEIEVDVYEEVDGQWRSIGETQMVAMSDLSEWDVEESDIGPMVEDTSTEENASVEELDPIIRTGMQFFDTFDDVLVEVMDVSDERVTVRESPESKWQESKEDVLEKIAQKEWRYAGTSGDQEQSLIRKGMEFFSTTNDSTIKVLSVDGNIATVRSGPDSKWKENMEDIIQKLADGDWEHAGDSEEMIDTPDLSEGMMVEWQVNPEMKGKIVHNPEDEPFVMVEVMENGEMTGYTLTAGYTDIRQVDSEEMADPDPNYSQGDWVRWDTRNSTEIGKVTGSYTEGDDLPDFRGSRNLSPEGDEILYALRMYDERDGTYHPIEGKSIGHYEESIRSAEKPANVSDSPVELGRSNISDHEVEEDDWVQWYPSETTEEHGFVLDVEEPEDDDEEAIVTIEVWTQNSDGTWETDGEEITKPMDEVGYWGNFPRGQEEFADEIEPSDPRRAVQPEENTASDELISEQVKQTLKDKAEEHNEEYGDEDGKRVTYRMLKNVFERGMGAYQDSHREGMSPQQWSYARVNAFLYLVRNGQPENDQYVQDNDLLPEDHPKYNEGGDTAENSLTTRDAIVAEVFGEHDPMGSDEDETPQSIVENVVTAELESDEDELDEVYDEWSDSVNMTASELRQWSGNPCSREASIDPVAVIRRNLELLETNKSDWTSEHISDAKRTISFIARMRGADTADKDGGAHGCPSKRDISLLNWAYNPFDELPSHPDSDDLDSVEEVELRRVEGEEQEVQTLRDQIDLMRESPERFTPQDVDRAEDDLAADEGETRSGEASDVASLAEYEMHEVSYEGTHDNEWDRPNLEDFVEEMGIDDDISEYDDLTTQAQKDVASAFILSASGFPADDYGDLKLPVVEPSGELSLNALAAVKGGHGASAVEGLSDEMESDIIDYVNQLAEDEFDRNWSEEEAMPKHHNGEDDEEYMDVPDAHMFESESDAEEKAEDMGISGAHKMGDMWVPGNLHEEYEQAVDEMEQEDENSMMVALPVQTDSKNIQITNMTSLQEELDALDNPVAVEADELEQLEEKADRLDTMSDSLEELRERTEVLDEVDRDSLEELREADEPMVVEAEEYEELEAEAEQVKDVYAASLAEEMGVFSAEELTERFSIEELREKFEDEIGSVEEELAANGSEEAQPRSQDPSEEELEESDGGSEEELSDEVAEKQEEIRNKILSK